MADNNIDKRQAILRATLDLISEHGFHGTPMSMIAQAAQVGVGTIYRYFNSKEDLINALDMELKAQLSQAILEGDSEDLPIRVRFCNSWLNLAHYYLNHPKELSFLEQYSNSPYLTVSTRQENERVWRPVVAFFEYAQAQQVIKDIPVEILTSMVFGSIAALIKYHITDNFVLDEINMKLAVEVAWDAVKR